MSTSKTPTLLLYRVLTWRRRQCVNCQDSNRGPLAAIARVARRLRRTGKTRKDEGS